MVDGEYVDVRKEDLEFGDLAYAGHLKMNANVTVKANDDTRQMLLAGGVSAGMSAAAGAAGAAAAGE